MYFDTWMVTSHGGRRNNEDYCGAREQGKYNCWIVADGLGGHIGGEIASRTAVDVIISSFSTKPGIERKDILEYMQLANNSIVKIQRENIRMASMRTTIVLLLSDSEKVSWGHIGDSRLYVFRNGSIVLQTRDHSVSQAAVYAGEISLEQIRFHEDRNKLLKVLGNKEGIKPAICTKEWDICKGDAFLLCTDGFWEYVDENCMEECFSRSFTSKDWLALMEEKILEKAGMENDNYTAVAIRYK